jgi:hypothetical protein
MTYTFHYGQIVGDMVAIDQVQGARVASGMGRYSLWTGDLGLAIYLRDCIAAKAGFPTIDVF